MTDDPAVPTPARSRNLRLTEIGKTFSGPDGPVRALQHVHLEVEPGECVAICGRNGCGKTTLLLSAGGLLQPDSGSVRFAGTDPYSLPPNERAAWRSRHVGFVFQQLHLIPYLNVLENVLTPSLAHPGEDRSDRANALLRFFQLEHRIHHLPGALSSGERQRVGLARATLHQPRILLADEPTGNLDDDASAAVLSFCRSYAGQGGIVIIATHDPQARAAATRVLPMDRGRLSPS
ncbi:MAG TPA: ABC transporter ATP-binding protein [Verrucomicrobiales bacterium]|nr:ABC transporter ATP-binding protein [Verrucomicrobiales bacterium]